MYAALIPNTLHKWNSFTCSWTVEMEVKKIKHKDQFETYH